MLLEVNVDQDKLLDKLSTSQIVDYLKNTSTLRDVLSEWLHLGRNIFSDEEIIEMLKDEL